MASEALTVPEPVAAKRLGISYNSFRAARKRGEIPHVRVGRRILIPVAALERLVNG